VLAPYERGRNDCVLSTDPARLDVPAIHAFLSRAYWSEEIPLDVVERSIRGSLCFGLYEGGRQVGFARVITDGATFAYLADVYVLDTHRGRGLATWMMGCVMAHPLLQGLRRFMLGTRDAHGLYAKFGFVTPAHPEIWMEIARPDIYKDPRDREASANK
jgi:GNAT superfamily N-acetyltransferase